MSATSPPAFDSILGPLVGGGYALAVTLLTLVPLHSGEPISKRPSGPHVVCTEAPQLREESSGQDEHSSALDLDRALDRLTPERRLPLLLHFYMDMTFQQVGNGVGLRMTAARPRIYRALGRLHSDLQLETLGLA
jgi:hypothetical protein